MLDNSTFICSGLQRKFTGAWAAYSRDKDLTKIK
jgi:hypothetical protein